MRHCKPSFKYQHLQKSSSEKPITKNLKSTHCIYQVSNWEIVYLTKNIPPNNRASLSEYPLNWLETGNV